MPVKVRDPDRTSCHSPQPAAHLTFSIHMLFFQPILYILWGVLYFVEYRIRTQTVLKLVTELWR